MYYWLQDSENPFHWQRAPRCRCVSPNWVTISCVLCLLHFLLFIHICVQASCRTHCQHIVCDILPLQLIRISPFVLSFSFIVWLFLRAFEREKRLLQRNWQPDEFSFSEFIRSSFFSSFIYFIALDYCWTSILFNMNSVLVSISILVLLIILLCLALIMNTIRG